MKVAERRGAVAVRSAVPLARTPLTPLPPLTVDAVRDLVADALVERCRLAPDDRVVAACSGGADSVALVHLLGGLGRVRRAAFIDHGLRDVTAERDAAEAAARAVDVPFVAVNVGLTPGPNLQARARAARYEALLGLADQDFVATGHTLTDRAETVLVRLLRGSGPRGLATLPWRDGRRVRPLLGIDRPTTRGLGWPFVDDPSNAGTAFQRNRVRHRILPLLKEENPAVESALADLADELRAQRDLVDALLTAVDPARVDLAGLEPAAVETFLHAVLARRPDAPPPRRQAVRAWAAALSRAVDGAYPLGQDALGLARGGRLRITRAADPRSRIVVWGPGTYRRGRMTLEIRVADSPCPVDETTGLSCWRAATEIVWPLTLVREARPGDGAIDLDTGRRPAALRLVDGRGRTVLPTAPTPASSRRAGDGPAGIAGLALTISQTDV